MNSARSTHPHVSTPGFELEELAPLVSPQQILPAVDRPMTTPSTPPTLPTLNFNSPAEFTAPIDANPMRISERTAQWIAENPYDETQRAQQRSSVLNTAWFVLTNLGTIANFGYSQLQSGLSNAQTGISATYNYVAPYVGGTAFTGLALGAASEGGKLVVGSAKQAAQSKLSKKFARVTRSS